MDNNKIESINLWKMFSNLQSGIRIGINTKKIFSESGKCETQVTPIAFPACANSFLQKTPSNTIEVVETKVCRDCKKEISDILKHQKTDSSVEEIIANIQRKNNLPNISSNSLACPNEVRLISRVCPKPKPYNKKDLIRYEREIDLDYHFRNILVSLPSDFFEDIEIVVAPDFSETDLITLNAYLSNNGLPTAIKSNLTNLYQNSKQFNIITNLLN